MACFAIHLAAGVLGDRVIADQADTALGPEVADHEAGKDGGQRQARPLGQGEDAAITGRVALGQACDGAQQVGDGTPDGREDIPVHAERLQHLPGSRTAGSSARPATHRRLSRKPDTSLPYNPVSPLACGSTDVSALTAFTLDPWLT
ncbi:MAG TPA: hypothetical protein VKU02_20470 [Gemmataceae bacterium]|nr:hypothetical protein [Gemmataceae bacterium]